jgi:RNA recognition motif-containing protein
LMTESNQYDADQSNESETDTMDNSKEDPSSEEQSAPAPILAAPKNWANLVKGGPSLGFAAPQPEIAVAPQPQSFVAITQQQQQQAQQQQKVQADNFGNGERRPMRSNNERERRTSATNYNSGAGQEGNCQLFLGNLPTRATEEELRQMFSVFGKIVDLRIHNKPQQKNSQNRPVPNYGFITFEDPASALKLQDSTVSLKDFCLNILLLTFSQPFSQSSIRI